MARKQFDFATYQKEAWKTDRAQEGGETAMMIPLLGLAGEVGTLLAEHKKHLRDKEKYRLFKERIEEDLGDILWYVANLATKSKLDLDKIARKNLQKVRARWAKSDNDQYRLFDDEAPEAERIPRHFSVDFKMEEGRLHLYRDGKRLGDPLTDNAYDADGYRYHDVFHFAYAAVLGWSPVARKLLAYKRKGDPVVDEVEDGGRANACEEGISHMVYQYSKERDLLRGATEIDHDILRTITRMTADLEVARRTAAEWEKAILVGFEVWYKLVEHGGGTVIVDLVNRSMFYASHPRVQALPKAKRLDGSGLAKAGRRPTTRYQRVSGGRTGPR